MALGCCLWRSGLGMLRLRMLLSPHRCLPSVTRHGQIASRELGHTLIAAGPLRCYGAHTRVENLRSPLLAENRVCWAGLHLQTLSSSKNFFLCTRTVHTSPRRNLLPPHVWLLIKPAQKLAAIILGRSLRKWWRALPANKRQLFRQSARRNRWRLGLSAAGLGLLFILFYFTNLQEAPVTGRTRLLLFRKEHYDLLTSLQYDSLIDEFKDEMLPEEDARYQLVQKLLQHLIACNSDLPEVTKIKWTLHVVDQPIVNAFVLPNGQIFVFTGMLAAVKDIHMLAFLMGHELAHAILDHAAEQGSIAHFLDFLFLISLVMIWAICPMDSVAMLTQWIQSKLREIIFTRPFSRTLEAEADKVGLELAAKACMDVRASSVFWKQMDLAETVSGEHRESEWLSTHPSHQNRAEHLERLIPEALQLRESCGCPPLSSADDPRINFERTLKQLLNDAKEHEDKAIKGVPQPIREDRSASLAPAIEVA